MSEIRGGLASPPTLERCSSKEAAKARAAAHANIPPHRCAKPAQLSVAEVQSRSEHGRRPTTSRKSLSVETTVRQPPQPAPPAWLGFEGRATRDLSLRFRATTNAGPSMCASPGLDVRHNDAPTPVSPQAVLHHAMANFWPRFPTSSRPERWVPIDLRHERRHSRGRSQLPRSPDPTLQLCCTLRGGGQKGRGDGHTGRCERLGEGGDKVGAATTPRSDGDRTESSTGGNGRQCQTRSWAALGTQHCPLVVRESDDPRFTVDHFGAGSCFVLSPSAGAPWLKLVRLSWRRAGTMRQRGQLGGSKLPT